MMLYVLTSKNLPNLCSDDNDLLKELKERGITSSVVVWDQFDIPANSYVLIRTIWDYADKKEKFKRLLYDFSDKNIKCFNDVETLLWNMDKSYLLELEEKKCNIVPTRIVKKFKLNDLSCCGFDYPLVIKPLVGASGINTFMLKSSNHNIDLSSLISADVIIQPFMSSIQKLGEYSFIFFDGRFSHAVLKKAKEGEFRVQDDHGGTVKEYIPTQWQLEEVKRMLEKVQRKFLYARVDVVLEGSTFYLMELEVIEPELFFRFNKKSVKNFVDVLIQKLII
ncbi:MAG: hypothetical protein N4A33_12270 [Bacteriovoracaceae bacterium]|jgi:glutathione synthase/RimK-type ligase-like ATP-grasp enzyme|nr:hypothetical protein [Bacteriovoracaceae bacterium]